MVSPPTSGQRAAIDKRRARMKAAFTVDVAEQMLTKIPHEVLPEAVDLRKGYDGLFGLVKQGLGRDPLSGDLFLFVNARRKGCKVLVWDCTGLCISQKRPHKNLVRLVEGFARSALSQAKWLRDGRTSAEQTIRMPPSTDASPAR